MGIFSTNRNSSVSGVCLEADNNYSGLLGLKEAELDQVHNDKILFEALIGADFISLSEGTSILNEGTLRDVWDKVKAFLKKIIEKLKGVINSIIAAFTGKFGKNNEAFVKKYKSEVLKKDLSKLKYKWIEAKAAMKKEGSLDRYMELSANEVLEGVSKVVELSEEQLKLYEDKIAEGDFADELRGHVVGSSTCSAKDFKKELEELYLEDPEDEEGLDSGRLTIIMRDLCDKQMEKDLNKAKSYVDKYYNKALKVITTAEKDTLKRVGDKNVEDQKGAVLDHKRASLASRSFSIGQQIQSAEISIWVECGRKLLSNRRAVFAKAAAYRKGMNEEAYLDAVEETAAFDMEDFNF